MQLPSREYVSYAASRGDSPQALSTDPPEDPNELSEADEVRIHPCPDPPRPGIMAAAHLAILNTPESTHQEPSFFAYGSTIALEDAKGNKLTF